MSNMYYRRCMKLCLNMIVKNEAANLPRLLESVADHVTCYAILDTGSTDGSPDLIRTFFEERDIPGAVYTGEFGDYSQARNDALELARATPLDFDALLLVDADMELVVSDVEQFRALAPATYKIAQQGSRDDYANIRIVPLTSRAKYRKRTHEYLHVPHGSPVIDREIAWLIDHESGANRGEGNRDKLDRDLRLLTLDWRDAPDFRTAFYLAETHWGAWDPERAISWYERARQLGGSVEEMWYASYKRGRCLLADVEDESDPTGKKRRPREDDECAEGVAALLEAHQERPTRAEPLLHLARHYRLRSKNDLACLIAEVGKRIPYPTEDRLFIEHEAYSGHGFDGEIGISGWYAKLPQRRDAARVATLHLSACASARGAVRRTARSNSRHYARPLFTQAEASHLRVDLPDDMVAFNPSVATAPDGKLAAVVRTANYPLHKDAKGACRWERYTVDDPVRTENYFVKLDPQDLTPRNERKLRIEGPAALPSRVRGYEDMRPFAWRGRWWATATVLDRGDGMAKMVLLDLEGDTEVLLDYGHDGRHEKNWMPLVVPARLKDWTSREMTGDELYLVYTLDPTVVLHVNAATLEVREISRSTPSVNLTELRGGSQIVRHRATKTGVATDDRWLCVGHEIVRHASEPMHGRYYLHRLVELEGDPAEGLTVSRVSWPFTLLKLGVEFCAGLCHAPGLPGQARDGSGYLVSFGAAGDEQARLATLPYARVEELLEEGSTEP